MYKYPYELLWCELVIITSYHREVRLVNDWSVTVINKLHIHYENSSNVINDQSATEFMGQLEWASYDGLL